ncbi:ketoacyl-ACP synthase III family protein [Nocardiopsis sediminis]|uniref:Ketoacyl-ACP synthase III family protein n=1 Tax=Nocardiopsis sediminis TaxID=1778267 RepID=A0ABV8FRR6_9ACTN
MRFGNLYIAGTGRHLPPPQAVADAVRAGLCERRAVWRTGIESVCVSAGESGPEMAVHAARRALRQSGGDPAGVALLLHAGTYFQGHDMWAPASYVQRAALGNDCPAIEVRQMSNGGLAALELAAAYTLADPARERALITTGDRFARPGFDRWASDPGTVYADGGTALVLSSRSGFARLRSLVTVSDPALEAMQRGTDPFSCAPLTARTPIDVEVQRRAYVAQAGLDTVLDRIDAGQAEALKRALDDAGADLGDIDRFVLPNLGRARMTAHFYGKFDIDPDRTTWDWGRRIGHLGAGDQIAGLGHLADSGHLLPGHLCLLAGVGAGFTWSVAVVEMLSPPPPPTAAGPTLRERTGAA